MILPLNIAVLNNNIRIIRLLLSAGANVDFQNEYGATALHNAVGRDFIDIVKTLLLYGANVNLKTKSGMSALYMAVSKTEQNIEIIKLLLMSPKIIVNEATIDIETGRPERSIIDYLRTLRGRDVELTYLINKHVNKASPAAG